jgi:uncharacterized protein (TIGR00725 family)
MVKTTISVIGPSQPTSEMAETAYEVGKLIASRGWVLVSGGGPGVSEWASRGAKEAGGITVGILPDSTHDSANPYIDIAVPTAMGQGRNYLVVASGHAVIAVGTSFGTISEIALSLRTGKFIVGLHIPTPFILPLRIAHSPDEALVIVEKYLKEKGIWSK